MCAYLGTYVCAYLGTYWGTYLGTYWGTYLCTYWPSYLHARGILARESFRALLRLREMSATHVDIRMENTDRGDKIPPSQVRRETC